MFIILALRAIILPCCNLLITDLSSQKLELESYHKTLSRLVILR